MYELDKANKLYPIRTLLGGFISYLIGGSATGLIVGIGIKISPHFFDVHNGIKFLLSMILAPAIGTAIGSVLLKMTLKIPGSYKKAATTSVVGELLGLLGGGMVAAMLFPTFWTKFSEEKSGIILTIIAGIIFNVFHATFTAPVFCGKNSSVFFMVTSFITASVCGVAVISPFLMWMQGGNADFGESIELPMMIILMTASLGITTGLSIGLYSLWESKSKNKG